MIGVDEAQIRLTQVVFREVNQRIAEITRSQREPASGFVCECGQPSCNSVIDLPLVEYEAVRRGEVFIAATGHCVEGVDRLAETRDGYDLVAQV